MSRSLAAPTTAALTLTDSGNSALKMYVFASERASDRICAVMAEQVPAEAPALTA